ncbi:unnamed protein product [Mytilus edulis]|uniref:Uncharacterized protein n=1 Tax=Mytilus edulis TaxID=6550 RepID=A0A8S3R850_MYTED|nr:unnamed protein product [Mytilus edulis]
MSKSANLKPRRDNLCTYYRHAALRRLLKVSFLTCLKECMKTSICSSKLVGKCARHRCKEGYKCVLEGDSISCEIACKYLIIDRHHVATITCLPCTCVSEGEGMTCVKASARLRHLLVHVGKNLETSDMELCGQFIGPAVNGKVIVTMCNTLTEGQIVKLTSVNDDLTAFHHTEVEVYGV